MRKVTAAVVALLVAASAASADPARVRFSEGLVHGFLALRTTDGATVADGDLIQSARAGRVTTRLVFRFRDGSVRAYVPAQAAPPTLSMVAFTPKPRLVKLEISRAANTRSRSTARRVMRRTTSSRSTSVASRGWWRRSSASSRPTRTSGFYPATRRPS